MIKFAIGFVFGIVIATTGFSNFASFVDGKIANAQEVIKENVK